MTALNSLSPTSSRLVANGPASKEGVQPLGRFELDADARRTGQGRTMLGGVPFRLLRFSASGARLIDAMANARPVADIPANRELIAQLVESGLAHPVVPQRPPAVDEVSVVIPVLGDADGLAETLASVAESQPGARVLVIDDGSEPADAVRIEQVVADYETAELVRLSTNQGPGAARNAGWQRTSSPLVAFLDVDVVARNWLPPLLGHFDDPGVAVVAPRVGAPNPQRERVAGTTKPVSVLSRYERVRSALDMGSRRSRVAPRTRVSYAPAAALVARRSALVDVDGFDESLRFGEDVDLLWRLDAAGHRVRYEPLARVVHQNRATWQEFVEQRVSYGSAAADLDQRHAGMVAPVELSRSSLGSWMLMVFGGPKGAAIGAGVLLRGIVSLREVIRNNVDEPTLEARDLVIESHLGAGKWLAAATTRTWLPFAVVGSVFSRRARRAVAAAIVIPATTEWFSESPDLDLGRWTAVRLLDDASYCAGVWKGALRARSARVLLPKINR